MKSVDFVDCDIIQDLLPSYSDKVSSDSTNKLIEKHLQKCKNCNAILKDMNKEILIEAKATQEKQIDYLKGYKKNKLKAIIFTIASAFIIFICILLFLNYAEFFINIDDISIDYFEDNNDVKYGDLLLYFSSEKSDLKSFSNTVAEEDGSNSIHVKFVGKYSFYGVPGKYFRTLEVNKNIDKVYIEDKNGRLKEIWNKDVGLIK